MAFETERRDDDEIIIKSLRDPNVVTPPTELQGPPLQSRFIFNPNQPWPPVLSTRFFPPPPWPENLEGENLTIEPVVGPFLALTEEQMEVPPGFGRFPRDGEFERFGRSGRIGRSGRGRSGRIEERGRSGEREEAREERRDDRGEDREERREARARRRRRRDNVLRSDDGGTGNVQDWPSGGGGE